MRNVMWIVCGRILVTTDVIWRYGQRRRVAADYLTSLSLGRRKQVATWHKWSPCLELSSVASLVMVEMASCPVTFLWLWPATDREPHCRYMPINKIWRRTESTPQSGWWCSPMAGIYSDCSTRDINKWSWCCFCWLLEHCCVVLQRPLCL